MKIIDTRTLFFPLTDEDELLLDKFEEDYNVRDDGYSELQGSFIDTPYGLCQVYFEKTNTDIFTYDSDENG